MGTRSSRLSDRALEIIMRDVLEGMQDLALASALRSGTDCCEVLWIKPQRESARNDGGDGGAEVLDIGRYRKAAGS
jgi:hypothetical protein